MQSVISVNVPFRRIIKMIYKLNNYCNKKIKTLLGKITVHK